MIMYSIILYMCVSVYACVCMHVYVCMYACVCVYIIRVRNYIFLLMKEIFKKCGPHP